MSRRRAPALLGTVLLGTVLALATTGCAALGLGDEAAVGPDGEGGSLDGGRVAVSAAFYPLAFVAEHVGGERVEVTQLTEPGGEPHDVELTVGETADVARADLVLLESGFQPAVDDAAEQERAGAVLDVRDAVELRPRARHDEEHDGEEHAGEDLDGLDPHFWLDPLLLADYADAVAERLGEIDAAHARDYAARASALRTELEELDGQLERGLQDCRRDVVLVNHDAFGYLTRYGLEIEPIAGISPDAEPSPADLARLGDVARRSGATTVFSERLVSPRTVEALAGDLGLRVDVLDPVEGLAAETADEDYLSLMRENLSALEEAGGC